MKRFHFQRKLLAVVLSAIFHSCSSGGETDNREMQAIDGLAAYFKKADVRIKRQTFVTGSKPYAIIITLPPELRSGRKESDAMTSMAALLIYSNMGRKLRDEGYSSVDTELLGDGWTYRKKYTLPDLHTASRCYGILEIFLTGIQTHDTLKIKQTATNVSGKAMIGELREFDRMAGAVTSWQVKGFELADGGGGVRFRAVLKRKDFDNRIDVEVDSASRKISAFSM